jgi:hypothetical protein
MATRAKNVGQISAREKRLAKELSWNNQSVTPFYPSREKTNLQKESNFVQTVIMNESICRIGISVFEEQACFSKDNRTLIAGLEFIYQERDQPNQIFGYQIQGKQFYIDIESWNDIRGFELVAGARGIHAIRIHLAQVSH